MNNEPRRGDGGPGLAIAPLCSGLSSFPVPDKMILFSCRSRAACYSVVRGHCRGDHFIFTHGTDHSFGRVVPRGISVSSRMISHGSSNRSRLLSTLSHQVAGSRWARRQAGLAAPYRGQDQGVDCRRGVPSSSRGRSSHKRLRSQRRLGLKARMPKDHRQRPHPRHHGLLLVLGVARDDRVIRRTLVIVATQT